MGRRILIIEDDQHFAGQLKELFEFHGHRPLHAASGPDGIAMAKEQRPDLILVDVMLPQVHGIRVLEEIRVSEGGADVPALLMSAVYKNESLFSRDMKRLGVLAFMSKPFSLIDLGRKVNGILAEPEAGRARTRELRGLTGARSRASETSTGTHYSISTGTNAPTARPDFDEQVATGPIQVGRPSPGAAQGPPDDGNLSPQRYIALLTHLFHSHASGRLELHLMSGDQVIYFLNGYPVWVETSAGALVSWLEDEGIITEKVAARLLRDAGPDWNPADALVRVGAVAPDDMPALMEGWIAQEVRAGIRHLGSYTFQATDDFAGMIPVYEVNPIREVWEAVQALDIGPLRDEVATLAKTGREIGRTRTFNRLFGYVATTPTLRSLGEHLLRPRSLQEVRSRFGAEEADVTRCLWLLISAGLVALSDAAPTSRAAGRPRTGGVHKRPAPERPAPQKRQPETRRFGKTTVDQLRRASGADDTPVARIARDYVTRMELDHYEFLGVHRGATAEEIDVAYRELAPAYRLRNLGTEVQGETRRQAKELLSRLVTAFGELSDPARRKRYDALLDRASKLGRRPAGTVSRPMATKPVAPAQPLKGAHIDPLTGYPSKDSDHRLGLQSGRLGSHVLGRWRLARSTMAGGDFRRAFAMLEELRTSLPSEPGLLADMAWCRLNLGAPGDVRTIDKALEWVQLAEAFEMGHPDVVEVHARIMVRAEDDSAAVRALRRVLKSRPELTWAKTELKRREARATSASDEGGGLFGGLFGRGKGGRR